MIDKYSRHDNTCIIGDMNDVFLAKIAQHCMNIPVTEDEQFDIFDDYIFWLNSCIQKIQSSREPIQASLVILGTPKLPQLERYGLLRLLAEAGLITATTPRRERGLRPITYYTINNISPVSVEPSQHDNNPPQ